MMWVTFMSGKLEEAYYSAEGLAKFAQMADQGLLQEVYRNDGTVIYAVERPLTTINSN